MVLKKMPPYRNIRDYSNEELICFIDENHSVDRRTLTSVVSEILRRLNQAQPLFPVPSEKAWDNPLVL